MVSVRVPLYTNKLNTMGQRSVGGFHFCDEFYFGALSCFLNLRLNSERVNQFSSETGKVVLSNVTLNKSSKLYLLRSPYI